MRNGYVSPGLSTLCFEIPKKSHSSYKFLLLVICQYVQRENCILHTSWCISLKMSISCLFNSLFSKMCLIFFYFVAFAKPEIYLFNCTRTIAESCQIITTILCPNMIQKITQVFFFIIVEFTRMPMYDPCLIFVIRPLGEIYFVIKIIIFFNKEEI